MRCLDDFITVLVIAIGWANIKLEGAELPKKLQQSEMPVITTDTFTVTCYRAHGVILQYGQEISYAVTDNMLCAGFAGGGTGACGGDLGE